MKKLSALFILCFSLLSWETHAQLVVTTGQTAQQLAEIIAGPGVVVSNASTTGSATAIGAFSTGANATGLNLASGVIISSGDVGDASGPEPGIDASTGFGLPGNAWLTAQSGVNSNDAAILEFDFVPNADFIQFRFVFGSEEYPNFVCSNYNDLFAITLEGVTVPYPLANIALIPGTSTPVSINNVNDQGCGNAAYYIDNSGNNYVEFGGFTVPIVAEAQVICGETYHLAFLIADGFDGIFDSGCFIEENSLTTGNVSIETSSLGGDTAAIEGCADLQITLTLNGDPTAQDYLVPVWIGAGSSAQWGIDYDPIGVLNQTDSTIVIPAGSNSVSFTITPVNDNISEGVETIELVAVTSTCGTVDTFTLYIADLDPLSVITSNDTTICQGNAVLLAEGAGGGGGFTYTWDNGFGVADTIFPSPAQTTTYTVTVSDNCGSTPATDQVTVTVDGGPVPFAGNDVSVCIGGSVLLNASSNAPNCSFSWDPPTDLSNPNIFNPLCTPQMDMEYIVTVTRPDGCSNDDTVQVTITPPPTAEFNLPTVGCAGTPLLVHYTGNADASAQYQWDFGGGTVTNGSGIGPLAVVWDQPGSYTVNLTVAWAGCVSNTETHQINILGPPPVNAGNDIAFCSGESAVLGAVPFGVLNYTWIPSTGLAGPNAPQSSITLVNPTHDIQEIQYVLEAMYQGCKNRDTVLVTVYPTPTAEFAIPDGKCFNVNSFNLTATGYFGPNATFSWDFGPVGYPASSTQQQPQGVIFNAPGLQDVSLVVEDNGCVSDTFVGQIDVFEMPDAQFAADLLEGCEPLTINFEDQSYNGGSTLYRNWSFGDGGSSTQANPAHVYTAGLYDVRLDVVTAEGCADFLKVNSYIEVYPKPDALFSIDPKVIDIIDPKVTVTNLADDVVSSEFTFEPYDYQVTAMQASYSYADTGVFAITQIVATEHGCLDTISGTVEVDPHYTFYIPNAFTPTDDNHNEIWRPYGENIMTYDLTIYNRWDQELFFSANIEEGWDGTYKGKKVPQGVYIYFIHTVDILGEPHKYRGTISVIH